MSARHDRANGRSTSIRIHPATILAAVLVVSAAFMAYGSNAGNQGLRAEGAERPMQEEEEELGHQAKWFYQQRAFPNKAIPDGALLHARAEANVLARQGARMAAPTAPLNWTSFGPRPISASTDRQDWDGSLPLAGRVTAIANHPTNSAVAYLGSAGGGVWKTTDSGAHWTALFDRQPSLSIGSIAIDPQTPNTVYVGTGESNFTCQGYNCGASYFGAGIFRSTNGGSSWSKIGGSTFNDCYVSNVLVKPGTSSTLFAAVGNSQGRYLTSCPNGVYRSTNSGSTWTRLITGAVTDLVHKPGAPNTVYAGFFGFGVWKSTSNGTSGTWSRLAGGLPTNSLGRVALATTPDNSARVYAAFGDAGGDTLGIWTSTNSGGIWSEMPFVDFCNYPNQQIGGQCSYDLALSAYPLDETFVYVGGIAVRRYNGTSWSTFGYGTSGVHVDIHALEFDAQNRIWIGSDGGAYLKANSSSPFVNLNQTLGLTTFYPGITGRPGGVFLGGTQDNGTLQRSGSTWTQFQSGDGGYTAYDAVNQWRFHEYIGATVQITDSFGNNGCLFTTLADFSADCNTYAADRALFIAPLIQSPTSRTTLFVGTDRIWRTNNSGSSWTAVSPRYAGMVSAIAQSRSDPNVIYAAWTGNASTPPFVAYTTDGGTSWFSTAALPNRFVTDIVVKNSAPGTAWVALSGYGSGHVYVTQNTGDDWANISGDLPDVPVNAIGVDSRTSPSTVYIGTDVGVLWSTDGGVSWANTSVGLPNAVVSDIRVDTSTNALIAATFGRGAFSAPIP